MAELIAQFEEACSNVEPENGDKENAAKAHSDVRNHLEDNEELRDAGIDTVLIGSYKRHVSIRRMKDVDVFVKLPDLDPNLAGPKALDLLETALSDAYTAELVERQDRSMKVEFPDSGLFVDAVPARPTNEYWEIPDRDGDWQETNPEELTDLTNEMNDRKKHKDLYVPIVKLLRQTRRAALGEERPGGLLIEILAFHAFDAGLTGSNLPQLYVAALRGVSDGVSDLAAGEDVADPTMKDTTIKIRATKGQLDSASDKFNKIAIRAEDALADEEPCRAAKTFQEILGKNSAGDWVFPLPQYCNADGTRKKEAARIAGDRKIPAGNRRFA
jgi:hypothetical protein